MRLRGVRLHVTETEIWDRKLNFFGLSLCSFPYAMICEYFSCPKLLIYRGIFKYFKIKQTEFL